MPCVYDLHSNGENKAITKLITFIGLEFGLIYSKLHKSILLSGMWILSADRLKMYGCAIYENGSPNAKKKLPFSRCIFG